MRRHEFLTLGISLALGALAMGGDVKDWNWTPFAEEGAREEIEMIEARIHEERPPRPLRPPPPYRGFFVQGEDSELARVCLGPPPRELSGAPPWTAGELRIGGQCYQLIHLEILPPGPDAAERVVARVQAELAAVRPALPGWLQPVEEAPVGGEVVGSLEGVLRLAGPPPPHGLPPPPMLDVRVLREEGEGRILAMPPPPRPPRWRP